MNTLTIQLDGNKTADVQIEGRVFPDRTCGQFESGWVVYDLNSDAEYFVSDTGDVYIGEKLVGVCHSVAEQFERAEASYGIL